MGFYYDHLDNKWTPIDHHRKLTLAQRRVIHRRRALIDDLLAEIAEGGDGVTGLYARLLACALVKTDELLMREVGKRVVETSREVEETVKRNQPRDPDPHRAA
jgi:hypothetical protein